MSPEQEALATRLSEMAGKAGARAVFEDSKSDFLVTDGAPLGVVVTETELAEMLTAACFAAWTSAADTFVATLRKRIEGPEGHVGWLIKELMQLQSQHGDLPVICGEDSECWDASQVTKVSYWPPAPNDKDAGHIAVLSP